MRRENDGAPPHRDRADGGTRRRSWTTGTRTTGCVNSLGFLVAFAEEERFEMIPASVIGMPGGRVVEGIEIDRGSSTASRSDMPVVVPGRAGRQDLQRVSRAIAGRAADERVLGGQRVTSSGAASAASSARDSAPPRRCVSWEMDYVPARSDIRGGRPRRHVGTRRRLPAGPRRGKGRQRRSRDR